MLDKLQQLMDNIPEDMRMIIVNKYSSWGKPQSKKVEKVLKVISWLSDTEKKELMLFMWDLSKTKEGEEDEEKVEETDDV